MQKLFQFSPLNKYDVDNRMFFKGSQSFTFDGYQLEKHIKDYNFQNYKCETDKINAPYNPKVLILQYTDHQEAVIFLKIDDIAYAVPCNNSGVNVCKIELNKDIVLVHNTQPWLQADGFSCHIYADKVKKFAEQNPEKVMEYLQPVIEAHPKVLEAIKNKEPLPKIEINKYFEGYAKYGQRLSVLSQEDLSKLSPRYLVENDKGKIQNFRLNYHGLKKCLKSEGDIDKLQELKAFKNYKKDERNFVERLQMQREDKTLDIKKH